MGKKIRILIALAVIVGVSFWAFSAIGAKEYSGSKIAFEVGNGSLVVTNPGKEAIPVEMRATGPRSTFRIESADLNMREVSKRVKIGRNVHQGVTFMLPPGQAKIVVARGSKVMFISPSDQSIQAVVKPMNASSTRSALFYTAVVWVVALYYISRTLEHSWIDTLRQRKRPGSPRLKRRFG